MSTTKHQELINVEIFPQIAKRAVILSREIYIHSYITIIEPTLLSKFKCIAGERNTKKYKRQVISRIRKNGKIVSMSIVSIL